MMCILDNCDKCTHRIGGNEKDASIECEYGLYLTSLLDEMCISFDPVDMKGED